MIDIDHAGIGARIGKYRRTAGMTAAELADRVGGGLTREILAKIETGKRETIDVQLLVSIAWALSVPLAALLFDIERPGERVDIDGQPHELLEVLAWLQGWMHGPEEWERARGQADLALRALERLREAIQRLASIDYVRSNPRDSDGSLSPADLARLEVNRVEAVESIRVNLGILQQMGIDARAGLSRLHGIHG